MHHKFQIIIAGSGGIGRAVALLLANYAELDCEIFIGDRYFEFAREAAHWISEGKKYPVNIIPFHLPESGMSKEFEVILEDGDLLLDCLPGLEAPRMARLALDYGLHYANLTEHVQETEEIIEMARDAETGFVLQTGLAPGFINVLTMQLYKDFVRAFNNEQVEEVIMRVGALTEHSRSPHFYGFTWSPIGVATEYVKDAVVIRNGSKVSRPALSERETLLISGIRYEADLTSGGSADFPAAFEGLAKSLDYKTIRYPGHYRWVEGILRKHGSDEEQIRALEMRMLKTIPTVESDYIIVYASVIGKDERGKLRSVEKSYNIHPTDLGGQKLRAIQATTAAPMAECARILLSGKWKGIVRQSMIDPDAFMTGPFVDFVYGSARVEIPIVHGI